MTGVLIRREGDAKDASTQRKAKRMKREGSICKPRREVFRQSQPADTLGSQPSNCKKINYRGLSHPVCSILYGGPSRLI